MNVYEVMQQCDATLPDISSEKHPIWLRLFHPSVILSWTL